MDFHGGFKDYITPKTPYPQYRLRLQMEMKRRWQQHRFYNAKLLNNEIILVSAAGKDINK
jgi:hypothetical protein